MKLPIRAFLAAVALAALLASSISAQVPPHFMKGNVLKFSQPIQHVVDPSMDFMHFWGEDIPSDFDWDKVMVPPQPDMEPLPPNWIIADDFRDPFDTPVLTVRWWGSYVGPTYTGPPTAPQPVPFGPGSEDGYAISFFRDIPPDPAGGVPFSRPGELLGTYVLPFEKVWVEPTPYHGWPDDNLPPDDPRLQIYEYKANLMDAHLDHPSDLADQMGFNQRPGEIYWISIAAFVGHKPVLIPNQDGTVRWEVEETNKFALEHYWGWHTSPFNHAPDIAVMGHLVMPGNEWLYGGWNPVQPRHNLPHMAFELFTVPEPASALLLMIGTMAMLGIRRRT
jgi:hypothetical protein